MDHVRQRTLDSTTSTEPTDLGESHASEQVANRVVIVTGATSGIGEATARLLFELGGHPVLAGRREDRLRTLSDELGGALAVPTDMTVREQIDRLVEETIHRHHRVDGLINNAGASLHEPLTHIDPEAFVDLLNLNVVGVLAAMQAVAPHMVAAGHGRIVNVSSGTTVLAPPGVAAYAASKAAVNLLSEVTRKELAPLGVQVSLVLPSITATEFADARFHDPSDLPEGMVAHTPAYVARALISALRSGVERIDIPHGPERDLYPTS